MLILVVTKDTQDTIDKLSRLSHTHPPNQAYVFPCVTLEGTAAVSELLDLDLDNNPNKHGILTADTPDKLWQGVRERLLDVIIEVKNPEAAEWITNLLGGSLP